MEEIRVGIVGCGLAGCSHAAGFAKADGSRVAKTYDPVGKRALALADLHSAEACASIEELVENTDAVSICSPHAAHEEAAMVAAGAGRAILMEKPLASTMDGAERIADAVRAGGAPFMMGMTHRLYPEMVEAQRLLADGEIGDLFMAVDRMIFATDGFAPWVFDRAVAGGGVFLDNGVHAVDRLRWLVGSEVSEVTASTGTFAMDVDVEDNGMAFLRFENGVVAAVVQGVLPGDHLVADLELYGSGGLITVETWKGVTLNNGSTHCRRQMRSSMVNLWDGINEGIDAETEVFVRCLRDGAEPAITLRDGVEDLRVVLAIYEASRKGCAVRLRHG